MFLWLLIVGGTLVAISVFTNPSGLPAALGVVLFVIGLVWFFVVAFVSARREGTGAGRSEARFGSPGSSCPSVRVYRGTLAQPRSPTLPTHAQ
jgi:hypothetical protein